LIQRLIKWVVLGGVFFLIAGTSAYFTVSFVIKKEDRVIVPVLVGKDVATVLEILSGLGLNTKVKGSEYSDQVAGNHVLLQDPPPGSEIKKGRDVRIVLSKGPRVLPAPHLIGLSYRQARIILEQNGLCTGVVSRVSQGRTESETILAQYPEKGTDIPRGRCVDLLVSLGPGPRVLKMPDLTGRFAPEAQLEVQRMNLVLGPISTEHDPYRPEDVILEQDPPAGHPVFEGQPVNLVQNRKHPLGKRGPQTDQNNAFLFRYRLRDGFLKTRIRLKFNGYGLSGDVIDAYMNPGDEILFLIPEGTEGSLRLYEDDTLKVSRQFKP